MRHLHTNVGRPSGRWTPPSASRKDLPFDIVVCSGRCVALCVAGCVAGCSTEVAEKLGGPSGGDFLDHWIIFPEIRILDTFFPPPIRGAPENSCVYSGQILWPHVVVSRKIPAVILNIFPEA